MMTKLMTAAAAALTLFVTPAAAESTRTQVVSYADLNLATAAGSKQLLQRLNRAAQHVCDEVSFGMQGLDTELRYRACRTAALRDALRATESVRAASIVLVKAPATTASR